MRRRCVILVGSILLMAGCGDPPRGAGVHELTPAERIARDEARFAVGEGLSVDEVERRLRALGLQRDEMVRTIDEDYGIEIVRLVLGPDRLAELDQEALARLNLDSNYRIGFADIATERAFAQVLGEVSFHRDQAEAIDELKRQGDWQRVPRRRGLEPMPRFARRLEAWCDYRPGEALNVIDGAWLEYTSEFVDGAVREAPPGRKAAQFDCLRRVVYATELRWNFIGNRGQPAR